MTGWPILRLFNEPSDLISKAAVYLVNTSLYLLNPYVQAILDLLKLLGR